MALELTAVTHHYRGAAVPAVHSVTVTIGPGLTGLVGINGAGKSTLLRALSRAHRPTGGSILLDGRDLYGRRSRREIASRVALMPQDFRAPGEARVLDVLLYCAWLKGVPRDSAWQRARELLDRVGLSARAGERIGRLSGGMLRRVALAQALISRPQLILLDEPTTGLDPAQRAQIRSLLVESLHDSDAIAVMSSHLMEDVATMAGRLVLLHEGAVRFCGGLTEFCRVDGQSLTAETAFLSRISRAG
jgi:ABC-2 type transport system ATP-binding protein